MKYLVVAAFALPLLTPPVAMADGMLTKTAEPALPEPESVSAALLRSSIPETEPLALPEPEMEAIAPYQRCSDREQVFLTN